MTKRGEYEREREREYEREGVRKKGKKILEHKFFFNFEFLTESLKKN